MCGELEGVVQRGDHQVGLIEIRMDGASRVGMDLNTQKKWGGTPWDQTFGSRRSRSRLNSGWHRDAQSRDNAPQGLRHLPPKLIPISKQ